ncbi:MAG TPA: hypothetical protein VK175_15665 [Leadbetterella sp.]|nr:hypothetical protein [Leadbetterella sp.]
MDTLKLKYAHELVLMFKDEADIPERFKKNGNNKTQKFKKDSLIEKRFNDHKTSWVETIETIIGVNKNEEQSWRFITIKPLIDQNIQKVTECQDFLDFTNLLIQRRNIDNCHYSELGNLCELHTKFQKEIEKIITK